jgi:hypothetical protein
MINAINYKIPNTQDALVPICVDLVRIVELVGDQLMSFACLELHLLLEVRIFVGLTPLVFPSALHIVSVLLGQSLLIGSFLSQVLHCWGIIYTLRNLAFTDCLLHA